MPSAFCPMDGYRSKVFVRWTDYVRRLLSDVRMTSAFCVSDADVRARPVERAVFAAILRGGARDFVLVARRGEWPGAVQVAIRLRLCFSSTFKSVVHIMGSERMVTAEWLEFRTGWGSYYFR